MSFQPFDRNPSGIVFFGTSATDKLYESVSTFTYDAAQNSLRLPNGGYIGTQGDFDSIQIASNGNVTLSQSLSIAGNLTVNGTTTTVNSTQVTVEDPIIVLGSGSPSTDDNRDRGIAFNWHTGSASRSGFFGFDDSTGRFTFIPNATITNEVVAGTVGDIEANLVGNASTATTLATSRNFSMTGEMTAATVSFNGGADVVLTGVLHQTAISSQPEITSVNDVGTDYILIWDDTDDDLKRISRANFVSGLGAMSSFRVSGVGTAGNVSQQIIDGDVLVFASGAAISFSTATNDTVSGILNAAVAGNGLTMSNQVLNVGAGNGITVAATSVSVTDGSGILVTGGGVHANLISYATQSVAANAASSTASRTYPIQVNGSDQLVVNVPWTDTGMTFTVSDGTNTQTIANTDTLRFQAGTAINFTVSATDTVSGTLNAAVAGVGLSMTNQVLAVDFAEFSAIAIASGDSFAMLDSDGSTEQRSTISNVGSYLAGNGLVANGGGVLAVGAGNGITVSTTNISVTAGTGIAVDSNGIHIDLSEYVTPVAFASGDSFLVLDSDGSTEQRGTVSQLGSYMAGTNVTAGGDGKLSVTDATIEGVVFTSANFVDSSRIDFTATAGQSVTADLVANSVTETYLSTSVAGSGLAGGNGTALTIDLNEYSSVAIASGDRLFTLDSDNATEQLTTISNLGAYLAGTNVTAGGDGKLSVTNASIESVVFTSANFVDSTDIDFTVTAGDSVTAIVINDSITDAKLRNSAALSVIGRSANSTGDPADIAAGTDNQVLRRSGTSIGFGAINLASSDAVTGDLPFSNLAQGSALSVLGVTGNATADVASIAAGVDGHVLRRSGTAVAFGTVATAGLADGSVTEVKRSRTSAAVSTTSTLSSDINLCTAGAGGITVTLPAVSTGRLIWIKKVDSAAGTVTVARGGSSTIDGATSVVLYHQYESLEIVCDGANWHIV